MAKKKTSTYQKYRRNSQRCKKALLVLLLITFICLVLVLEFVPRSRRLKIETDRVGAEIEMVRQEYQELLEIANELNDLQDYKFSQAMQKNLEEAYSVQDKIDELEEKL